MGAEFGDKQAQPLTTNLACATIERMGGRMQYPGRIIRKGEGDRQLVAAIIRQLASRGYPLAASQPLYDANLASLVKLFQSQHQDAAGRPLMIDGEIGPMTWGALFGALPVTRPPTGAAGMALTVAISQIGVMEQPPGSNSGPQVRAYLSAAGVPDGSFWCMAFVYWCFKEAASGGATPFPRTGGCLDAWAKVRRSAPQRVLTAADARANPDLVRPGMVFIHDYGQGRGHTGFVKQSIGGALRTIEGNSNLQGNRNGLGVFELNHRKVTDKALRGFIDFT